MTHFFSIDWGTSSLRVRLVSSHGQAITVCHEVTNQFGCAYVDNLFKNKDHDTPTSRESYFLDFLRPYLMIPDAISPKQPIPVVISGMATSSIGIMEVPYSCLPFALDGSSIRYAAIPPSETFDRQVLLLSGVCQDDDVMRGEEVQVIGLSQQVEVDEALFILPGTHSKHIYVKDQHIVSFKTYITGEMFHLLSTHSILKNSIAKSPSIDREAFRTGIKLSGGNLLHDVFTIRASSLLQNTRHTANYSLLSGLLIGTEIRDIMQSGLPIVLCAHDNVADSYMMAIQELSIQERCTLIPAKQVDESVIYGQKRVAEQILQSLVKSY